MTITITSTFTADPVQDTLGFWLKNLFVGSASERERLAIQFTQYNQVFQQLLEPSSDIHRNKNGVNVFLVRFEDWIRYDVSDEYDEIDNNNGGKGGSQQTGTVSCVDAAHAALGSSRLPACIAKISRSVSDFVDAIKSSIARGNATPFIICLCPSDLEHTKQQHHQQQHQNQQAEDHNSETEEDNTLKEMFQKMESDFEQQLAGVKGVHVISSKHIYAQYPSLSQAKIFDEELDKLAHIPFTGIFFSAIGTVLARKILALLSIAPFKVIVVDCDNTLWGGVVGEDGTAGIRLDGPFKRFHEKLAAEVESGVLLCMCSKNVEEDVLQVFQDRANDLLPLTLQHFVSWRINWELKAENIRSLATELSLGLDSFVFIDDNPVEVGQVREILPQVLCLQFPSIPPQTTGADLQQLATLVDTFLSHVWAFDHVNITSTDKERTQQYQQNKQRSELQKQTGSFVQFLEGLGLTVDVQSIKEKDVQRVTQLTLRTNQFNLTTRRYTEQEIGAMLESDSKFSVATVSVKDRFGDYGLVGVVIYCIEDDDRSSDATTGRAKICRIELLALSCRVLGRGVEYRILRRVGELARERVPPETELFVVAEFIRTKKNMPAVKFLKTVMNIHDCGIPSESGSTAVAAGNSTDVRPTSLFVRRMVPDDAEAHFFVYFPIDFIVNLDCNGIASAFKDDSDPEKAEGSSAPAATNTDSNDAIKTRTDLLFNIACRLHDIKNLHHFVANKRNFRARVQSNSNDQQSQETTYLAPRNSTETRLVQIFEHLLLVEGIGIADDLTAIGMTSLVGVLAIAKARKDGIILTIDHIHTMCTVESLAAAATHQNPQLSNNSQQHMSQHQKDQQDQESERLERRASEQNVNAVASTVKPHPNIQVQIPPRTTPVLPASDAAASTADASNRIALIAQQLNTDPSLEYQPVPFATPSEFIEAAMAWYGPFVGSFEKFCLGRLLKPVFKNAQYLSDRFHLFVQQQQSLNNPYVARNLCAEGAFRKLLIYRDPLPLGNNSFMKLIDDPSKPDLLSRAASLVGTTLSIYQQALTAYGILESNASPKENAVTIQKQIMEYISQQQKQLLQSIPANQQFPMPPPIPPIDRAHHKSIFSTRIARPGIDSLTSVFGNSHIVVSMYGYLYRVGIFRKNKGIVLSPLQLYAIMSSILEDARRQRQFDQKAQTNAAAPPSGGKVPNRPSSFPTHVNVLTSIDRNQWANLRVELCRVPEAKQTLEVVENAIFCVALEPDLNPTFASIPSPKNGVDAGADSSKSTETTAIPTLSSASDGPDSIARNLRFGDPTNRWFDKGLQIIVFGNGRAGLNFEHSAVDGVHTLAFATELQRGAAMIPYHMLMSGNSLPYSLSASDTTTLVSDGAPAANPSPTSATPLSANYIPERLSWGTLPDPVLNQIAAAQQRVLDSFARVDSFSFELCSTLPDSLLQLSIQAAFHSVFGRIPLTIEAVSLGGFHKGRFDIAYTVTPESVALMQQVTRVLLAKKMQLPLQQQSGSTVAWNDPSVIQMLVSLYKAADEAHKSRIRQTLKGAGLSYSSASMMLRYPDKNELSQHMLTEMFPSDPFPSFINSIFKPTRLHMHIDILSSTLTGDGSGIDIFGICPLPSNVLSVGFLIRNGSTLVHLIGRGKAFGQTKSVMEALQDTVDLFQQIALNDRS